MCEKVWEHILLLRLTIIETESLQLSYQELNSHPISVCIVNHGKEQQLFSGVIKNAHVEKEAFYDTVILSAYSLSWFMDLEKKNRSFQGGEKTIAEVLQTIAKEISFELLLSVEDKILAAPLIQYQEPDWEFLMRLSTYLESPAFNANDYEGKAIYIGLPDSTEPFNLKAIHEVWSMDADQINSPNWKSIENTYIHICGESH